MSQLLDRRALLGAATLLIPTRWVRAAASPFLTGPVRDWRKLKPDARLTPAFEYIEKTELGSLAVGRHDIDGDRVYITVTQSKSRSPAGEKFEAHRRYADIHVLISGEEMIGAAIARDLKSVIPYDQAKDIEMFEAPAEYERIRLSPGSFAVFLPGQAHLPGCHEKRPTEIKKAVVKVLMA